jgi:hypothetical protein
MEFKTAIFAVSTLIAKKRVKVFVVNISALSTLICIFMAVATDSMLISDRPATPWALQ